MKSDSLVTIILENWRIIVGNWIVCILVFNLGAFGRCIGITFVDSKHIVSLITSQRHYKDTASKTRSNFHCSKDRIISFDSLYIAHV